MSYSAALDRLMTSARLRLPGALDNVIKDELFIVVDEFMKQTKAWKEMIQFTTISGVVDYDLTPDELGIVEELVGVWDLTPTNIAITDDNWQVVLQQALLTPAVMPAPSIVQLQLTPSEARNMAAVVTMTVSVPTTKDGFPLLPTVIIDKYAHTDWLDGLLGRLMSQPAKPYSNQQMAVYHLRRWRTAMARARVAAKRMYVYGGQAWSYPQDFRVRHRRG